jgi:hypothetical protein
LLEAYTKINGIHWSRILDEDDFIFNQPIHRIVHTMSHIISDNEFHHSVRT